MSYRKKPVVIEAFQMTQERRWNNSEWPNWLHKAWQISRHKEGSLFNKNRGNEIGETLYIMTLEGEHLVTWDDWIIQGIKGEIYPCKPDIFEMTYEEVV